MAWLTVPPSGVGSQGAVILPPLAYEYWTSHRTLRVLAERLAGQGCAVVRVDHDGTGDSAGEATDGGRVAAWRTSAGVGAGELRRLGITDLTVIGLRLGANLALADAGSVGACRVVAWAPIASMRRYCRELRMLATPDALADDGIAVAGTVISAATLDDLGALDHPALTKPPAPDVLVIDRDDQPADDDLVDRLRALGSRVTGGQRPGMADFLDQPTEYATSPEPLVDEIAAWVIDGQATTRRARPAREAISRATIPWRSGQVTEEILTLGPGHLAAVMTEPLEPPPDAVTFGWLNAGSEPHVGPGRAWVEYARTLALAGHRSVRLDFTGWGESPDGGRAPGRPYDSHTSDDLRDAVGALIGLGHTRIVPAGLCAGAWVALRVAAELPIAGVVAINPQLYWQPGDPVEADVVNESRVRRQPEIQRFREGWGRGEWDALDSLGVRHPASDWLRSLAQAGRPVLMLFAAGDDGLEFLDHRVGRAWGEARHGVVTSVEIPDIDHPMHRHRHRPAVTDAIVSWCEESF